MIPGVSQEQFLGMIRTILACVGGFLIAQGVDAGTIETVTGVVVTVTGLIWSFASKRDPAPPKPPAVSPPQ